MTGSAPTLTVVACRDGKRGHERQTDALIAALNAVLPAPLAVVDYPVRGLTDGARRFAIDHAHLAIGAGHRTHPALVAAGRCHLKTIVLMSPSLPRRCFDLVIAPRHDEPTAGERLIVTEGPLCPAPVGGVERDPSQQLVLLGGDSPHYRFDEQLIATAVESILANATGPVVVADSRRTPEGLLARLGRRQPRLDCVPFASVDSDWLPMALARSGCTYITPDSLSMVYEALSAGAPVNLLALAPSGRTRVTRAMEGLVARGLVGRGENDVPANPAPLAEAARVAALLRKEWLPRWGLLS